MGERTIAQVTLASGMAWMASGEMELHVSEGGDLTVWDYTEPRDGNSIVLVAAKGEWRSAFISKTTKPAETQATSTT